MAGGNIREMGAGDSGDTITREGGKKLGNMEEDGFCAAPKCCAGFALDVGEPALITGVG